MKSPRLITTPIYIANAVPARPRRRWGKLFALLCVVLLVVGGGLFYVGKIVTSPPVQFPIKTEFTIDEGATTVEVTEALYERGFVRSPIAMYLVLALLYEPTNIKASTYIFSEPLSMFALAERLMLGDYGNDLVRFVHYEGEPRKRVAERAAKVLDNFNAEEFLSLTAEQEGMLFPDTYLLPVTFTANELADLLYRTYLARIEPLRPAIANHYLTEQEIITLASILEREANSRESKKIVSGILQQRLEIGMPLQVDASVEYVLDKPLSELTADDLREIDSPYNTYTHNSLPPTPIGNPGLTAIEAVLEPTPSPYLYYITGNDGVFYYAKTHAEHLRNVERYLRN